MRCFPLCLNVDGEKILLMGSGKALARRLEQLRPYSPDLRVFSPETPITESDLSPRPAFVLITDAPDDTARRVSALCREQGIPINVEDVPELCTFYFPSLITRGPLTVSIVTDGASPAASALIRRQVEAFLPKHTEEILDWAGALRLRLKEEISDSSRRAALIRRAVADAFAKDRPLTEEELAALSRPDAPA